MAPMPASAPVAEMQPTVAPAAAPVVIAANPPKPSIHHSPAVDTLVSAQTSFSERRALLAKLKKLGELDSAIAELRQRVAEEPGNAGISIALGEALMNKFPVQDLNEMSSLGLQIDQSFDAALKTDAANWEAQYNKAIAMSYWPDIAGKGPEVIQRLSTLIDQQETMPPQPQFAQTYVWLGKQYQKNGEADKAAATWQMGLQKFPNDPALQKAATGAETR